MGSARDANLAPRARLGERWRRARELRGAGACRRFLAAEITSLSKLRAILALGAIAHQTVLRTLNLSPALFPFCHGRVHRLPSGMLLADSYHCSRLNTNTGKLTVAMFESVFSAIARGLDDVPSARCVSLIQG